MIHSFADGRIEDTGPLTRKRMETIDDEVLVKAEDFIRRATEAGQPFFVWVRARGRGGPARRGGARMWSRARGCSGAPECTGTAAVHTP